jgi:DNA-binding beta-propeller fold protein YncE
MPERTAGKPVGLSFASDGRLFVADTHYHRVIAFNARGEEQMRFGREGEGPGAFLLPTDVAFDAAGRIYVAEYGGNDRITRWSADGTFECVLIAGAVKGVPLRRPAAVVVDPDERLWVADACNHRILCFDLAGRCLAGWGTMGRAAGRMRFPYDLSMGPDGTLVVCEYGNHRLQWFDATGRSLRVWGRQGRRVGALWAPWGVAVAPDGRVLVVDALNNRVQMLVP